MQKTHVDQAADKPRRTSPHIKAVSQPAPAVRFKPRSPFSYPGLVRLPIRPSSAWRLSVLSEPYSQNEGVPLTPDKLLDMFLQGSPSFLELQACLRKPDNIPTGLVPFFNSVLSLGSLRSRGW